MQVLNPVARGKRVVRAEPHGSVVLFEQSPIGVVCSLNDMAPWGCHNF